MDSTHNRWLSLSNIYVEYLASPCTKQPHSLVRENKPVYDSVRNRSSMKYSLLLFLFLVSVHASIPGLLSWCPSLTSDNKHCYSTFHNLLEIGDFASVLQLGTYIPLYTSSLIPLCTSLTLVKFFVNYCNNSKLVPPPGILFHSYSKHLPFWLKKKKQQRL